MNLFSYIKERVSILDVVSEYVSLKPAGSYWKGLSPFRQEKTPSFTVSPARGIYYCFSTAHGGDVIDFVAKMENCSPIEAAQMLAERYSIDIPTQLKQQNEAPSATKTNRQMHEKSCALFADWCHQQLLATPVAREYLRNRSISDETSKKFMLGYCPGGSAAVSSFVGEARKQGILTSDLVAANLLSEGNNGLYNPFEERIIFPIADHLGRPCGFGGRIFRPGDDRPKYYNSRDHDLFRKKQILYGLHHAKKQMQTTGQAYLVEGYMDCIAMAQAGYVNCVATLGTACTADHLAHLARLTQKVFVLYDGDTAGQQAIVRLAQLCWQVSLELMVIVLPQEDDPASFLTSHKSLDDLPTRPQTIFSFFISTLGNAFLRQQLQEKLGTIRQLLETIATLTDPLNRELLLQQAASAFDVPAASLKQELRKIMGGQVPKNPVSPPTSQALDLEKKIFSVILSSGINLCTQDETFLLTHLTQPFQRLLGLLKEAAWDFGNFFSRLGDEERDLVSSLALISPEPMVSGEPVERAFQELLVHFRRKKWREEISDMKVRLEQAQSAGNEDVVQKILVELRSLQETVMRGGSL